jgi:ligand-binding sensor domain-containing protein/signal transduction histidine kinase
MARVVFFQRMRLSAFGLIAFLVMALTGCEGSVASDTLSTATSAPLQDIPTTDNFFNENLSSYPWDSLWVDPDTHIKFEHYTIEEGLSVTTVRDILQDQKGFMWFATEDGLNKFDGRTFEVYRHDPEDPNSLTDSIIVEIYEDRVGNLWIGTYRGGLNHFDPRTDQFTAFMENPEDSNSLSDNHVTAILEDRSGLLWVGTTEGLNRYDPSDETWLHFRNDPDDPNSLSSDYVTSIFEDSRGTLWVGTPRGLDRFESATDDFTHFKNNPADPNSLSGHLVQVIFEDRSGQLWVGTDDGGLNRFNSHSETFTHYSYDRDNPDSLSSDDVRTIFEDPWGVLWIGTDRGLNRFDRNSEDFISYQHDPDDPYSLSDDEILRVLGDRSGGLWIATAYGGVNRYDRRGEQFSHYQADPNDPNSLSTDCIWSIYEDRSGILWIGTNGAGLDRFDRENGQWRHYQNQSWNSNSLNNNVVVSIYEDGEGMLWLGTWDGGLDRLDPKSSVFTHYRTDPEDRNSLSCDIVWLIYEDHEGALWVGTAYGLNRFDRSTGRFTRYLHDPDDPTSISDNKISAIYEDRSGTLWVGTHNGLNRFNSGTGTFTHYLHDPSDPQSLSHNTIFSIYQDASGTLWLGTFGGGLNRFDPESGTFTHFWAKDGLPNDVVYGILEDDEGHLWLSTNNGLSKFDPRMGTFRNFDVGDGLQAREFNYNAYFKNRSGEMFFGGVNGLNVFHPDRIIDNPYVPPVVLTSLSQDGEPVLVDETFEYVTDVTLRWPHNYFAFEFAVLSFFQPEENQYAYMLEGFDEGWNVIGTRNFGRYTNLPGGVYTLRLRGSNNDGVWNEEGVAVRIQIVPPVWQTWWFRGVLGFILLAGVLVWYRSRVRRIESHSKELEILVQERTQALGQRTNVLERRTRELEALYRADERMHRYLDLDQVLKALVDVSVDVLHANKSSVFVWDDSQKRLVMRVARGFGPRAMSALTFAEGDGVTWVAYSTGDPVFVEDAVSDPRRAEEPHEAMETILALGIRSFMHIPIKIGDEIFGIFNVNFTYPRAFGQDELRLFTALAQRAAFAIENARLFRAEKRRAEQFRVISEVGRHITSILDVDELLREIVRLIKETFGYYLITIGLIEGDTLVFKTGVKDGWEDPEFCPPELKLDGEGITVWVARTGEPLLASDVSKEPRYVIYPDVAETCSELAVPLKAKAGVIGVLNVESDQLNAFDESDVVVLQSLAHQAAVAIENARYYKQAQQAAVTEERSRLARDLHDAVTQTLFSASLIAEALPNIWASDQEEGRSLLTELRQLNRGALAEMRSLLMELRPAALVETNLGDLMRQLAEVVTGRKGLPVTVDVECDFALPEEVHVALYRIAQEALNNVVKHTEASHVTVSLKCKSSPVDMGLTEKSERGIVELCINDDGQGFDPSSIPPDCFGLGIIRERAQAVGASLEIQSQLDQGTTVKVSWKG